MCRLFEPEQLKSKPSVDYKIEDLIELDAYDTKWISNTGWNKLEHWIRLLNSQGTNGVTADSSHLKAITSMMADHLHIETVIIKVL